MEPKIFRTEVAGRPFVVETGELARQANGSVLVRFGDTAVLVTATATREPREGVDFFPLRVDWEERLYAAGRIPGSFFRREGRPTERAILSGRLTDRPIRPLFPKGFRNEVQIVVTVLSYDNDNLPEVAGIFGASCALGISDIPFYGPVAAAMVGRVKGEFVLNPTEAQRAASDLELTVAGTRDAIIMIEAGANQVPEDVILDGVYFAHEHIRHLIEFQSQIIAECGQPKMEVPLFVVPEEIEQEVRQAYTEPLRQALRNADKLAREEAVEQVKSEAVAALLERYPEQEREIKQALDDLEKSIMRRDVVEHGIRIDGRRADEIREISCRVGLLPRAHGSGLFRRGQTQVLT
ncbi:MAG TPA: polyribonucleotide nucleotidyltransferase, partial [Bacillota bacterium]